MKKIISQRDFNGEKVDGMNSALMKEIISQGNWRKGGSYDI